ncbi:TIGR02452 family protein [Clostridia bacterium]|nr:TIGR02452 family protein [Clostridia bacterium]
MDKQREQRSATAQETLRILREGRYTVSGATIDLACDITESNERSVFIPQDQAILTGVNFAPQTGSPLIELQDESTLAAILRLRVQGVKSPGVLNFASAKNPGGGFLNGALAQEESLAVASSLYDSQLKHPAYYETNRVCKSMIYTDCAIWSPDVVFFRDDSGNLLTESVKASVLTLPAVNYGQVILKNEDRSAARAAMKRRMKIALAIFAKQGCEVVILGAYGCGVFRNDPADIALWWDELLREYGGHFRRIIFAIFDRSKTGGVLSTFKEVFRKIKPVEY